MIEGRYEWVVGAWEDGDWDVERMNLRWGTSGKRTLRVMRPAEAEEQRRHPQSASTATTVSPARLHLHLRPARLAAPTVCCPSCEVDREKELSLDRRDRTGMGMMSERSQASRRLRLRCLKLPLWEGDPEPISKEFSYLTPFRTPNFLL
jgi:hypothetical protein